MKPNELLKYIIEQTVRDYVNEGEAPPTNPFIPVKSFEEDPMNYILKAYPSLAKVLTLLMSKDYKDLITGIYILYYQPYTYKIVLHNGQEFLLSNLGPAYEAKITAKRYYLLTIGAQQGATKAINQLLQLGAPINLQGSGEEAPAEGGEKAAAGGGGEEIPGEPPAEEGGSEEEKTES